MSKPIHPLALFRLSVLGPLASRDHLERGELKKIISELASKTHRIPGSKRTHLSPQIIERWYYLWDRGGIEALEPKIRCDKHQTQLSSAIQTALLAIKKDNPARSLNTLISMLEKQGIIAKGELARATVHRFLQRLNLSKRTIADAKTIERRSFVAVHAGDIWQGDVLHGPQISTPLGMRKTYLVSLLDDASRLITHCAFCLGETAIDIEGVLKNAVLKRGVPKKLIVDNGAAYKSESLQRICARLQIRLIYCPAREPEGKGKLERYHRTFRELFLDEIGIQSIQNLEDLNARLWVWIENVYHQRAHGGLENKITPLERWRQDLVHIRQLGSQASFINDIFYHRISRFVRKNGTVTFEGELFEVPYEHSGKTVNLVFDPHAKKAIRIESDSGEHLGYVTPLDTTANLNRHRQRPEIEKTSDNKNRNYDAVEMAYQDYVRSCGIDINNKENN
jgi:transposase InsO family protein